MMSQNGNNELVIGDTHHGLAHYPFDRKELNDLVLNYLYTFAQFPNKEIEQTWNGTYVKMKKGHRVGIIACKGYHYCEWFGGAGMSLSFGLLEEVVMGKYELAAI